MAHQDQDKEGGKVNGERGGLGSGEHRCEVNFSQQQGKWDATLPSAPPLRVSVEKTGEKEGTFFRGFHVYINVLQDKPAFFFKYV